MSRIMQNLADFKMTALAASTGLTLFVALFSIYAPLANSHAMPLLLLASLLAFCGLLADFRRMRRSNADIARQQRDLILQATLATMADTTNNLRHDLQLLHREAEEGQLPDAEALSHLRQLFETHVSRLQQLGHISTYSESWISEQDGFPGQQVRKYSSQISSIGHES